MDVHAAVRVERLGIADLLDELTPAEWASPSACTGWTIRDVAAHLTSVQRSGFGSMARGIVSARGNFDRMIFTDAVRHAAAHEPAELVAQLRATADSRKRPPGVSEVVPLLDVLAHGQDIASPLGRARTMPTAAALAAAQCVWEMGFPFHARKRLAGRRLVATDVEWAVGEGVEVRGPIQSLFLLATGRDVALRT